MERRTNAFNLQNIIAEKMVSITDVVVNYDDRGKEPITAEKFKEDLEFYINSGIFADTIDFAFERISNHKLHVAIGMGSGYCYDDIHVTLQLSDGVTMDTVTGRLCESFCN